MVRSAGKLGAWAEDAEKAEEEAAALAASQPQPAAAAAAAASSMDFPPLSEAKQQQQQKKKKPVKMPLSQFTTGESIGPGAARRSSVMSESRGLTPEEMLMLPTGPRERSEEELQQYGGLGGGFRGYGGGYGRDRGFRGDREQQEGGRDGRMGGFDERPRYGYGGSAAGGGYERRERESDRDLPSRADEADSWAAGKVVMGSGYGGEERRRERISDRDLPSRADEVDDWGSVKKFVPSDRPDPRHRFSGQEERRGRSGYGFEGGNADANDDWGAGKRLMGGRQESLDRWSRRDNVAVDGTERPRVVLQPRTRTEPSESQEVAKQETGTGARKVNPFGAARPREEVLAEKGQDWKKLEEQLDSKTNVVTPPSSAPTTTTTPSKPRVKVDPFGNAKPREVLLQERGQDYRKMDFELEHKGINRAETEAEKKLKDEIRSMTEQLSSMITGGGGDDESSMNGFAGEHGDLKELLARKEEELVSLTRQLDDKVRYAQRRPSSRSGSEYGDVERPSSRRGPRDRLLDRPPSGISETGSQYEAANSGPWAGSDRPLSRSSSRDMDDSRRFYQDRPPSGGGGGGGRGPDVWIADRPPSRSGSRDMFRRNGRPPSRSRDDYVEQQHSAGRQTPPTRNSADIWRRSDTNEPGRGGGRW